MHQGSESTPSSQLSPCDWNAYWAVAFSLISNLSDAWTSSVGISIQGRTSRLTPCCWPSCRCARMQPCALEASRWLGLIPSQRAAPGRWISVETQKEVHRQWATVVFKSPRRNDEEFQIIEECQQVIFLIFRAQRDRPRPKLKGVGNGQRLWVWAKTWSKDILMLGQNKNGTLTYKRSVFNWLYAHRSWKA